MNSFNKGKNRGPETSTWTHNYDYNFSFGFHRLAINGLDENSGQPMNIEDYVLICNGEIYNHTFLEKISKLTMTTGSDCEIIIHLYKKYGIYQTLKMLDGVFAFVLLDKKKGKNICCS